jgi:hypothetical protein
MNNQEFDPARRHPNRHQVGADRALERAYRCLGVTTVNFEIGWSPASRPQKVTFDPPRGAARSCPFDGFWGSLPDAVVEFGRRTAPAASSR